MKVICAGFPKTGTKGRRYQKNLPIPPPGGWDKLEIILLIFFSFLSFGKWHSWLRANEKMTSGKRFNPFEQKLPRLRPPLRVEDLIIYVFPQSMAMALRQLGYSVHDFPEHIQVHHSFIDFVYQVLYCFWRSNLFILFLFEFVLNKFNLGRALIYHSFDWSFGKYIIANS